ncbi:MAG: hypothetical protein KBF45_08470 [Cyclobacteriaceae bacterium]|nr:hypothetical protein [Cyclobacteriaceae bacterium]
MKNCFFAMFFVVVNLVSFAQVPGTLSYQGILMQNDGITPLADGAHSIVFDFYTASTGGTLVTSRTVPVMTTKGLFTCILGDGGSGGAALPASLGTQQIFIEIKVDGGAPLAPRAQLTPSLYAFQAQSTYTISDDAVTTSKILDGTIVNADINSGAAINDTKLATISTAGKVSGGAINSGTIGGSTIINTTGTITGVSFSGNGTGLTNVNATSITDGTIINADINASAAIVDTKLATITTAGKVSNSATTATSTNTNNAIVARDASGNFSTGVITGSDYEFSTLKTCYYSIAPDEFVSSSVTWVIDGPAPSYGHLATAGTDTNIYANLHLPQSANITEVRLYYVDNSSTDLEITLRRKSIDGLVTDIFGAGTITTQNNTSPNQISFNPAPIDPVENANFRYGILLETSGSQVLIYNVRITYTMSKVGN